MKVNNILKNLPTFMPIEENSNNYKFILSFSEEFDRVSSNTEGLKNAIQLSTATGTYLDSIGRLFALLRQGGEGDNDFRARIEAYWQGYIRGGVKEALIETTKTLTGSSVVDYNDDIPMVLYISSEIVNLNVSSTTILGVLNSVKPAGVHIYLYLQSSFTDKYNNYNDLHIFTKINIGWVVPDLYYPEMLVTAL